MDVTKLTINDMKDIIYLIFEELKTDNESISMDVLTLRECYNPVNYLKKLKLYKNNYSLIAPLFCDGAYYPKTNHIFIYFNYKFENGKIKSLKDFLDLFETIFHEFRHSMQVSTVTDYNISYEQFIMFIERTVKQYSLFIEYILSHNKHYFEIDAELFSIEKMDEYLKEYPELYQDALPYLKSRRRRYQAHYNNYNFDHFFHRFNIIYKFILKYSIYENSVFEVFYKKNGGLKNYDDIMLNSRINQIDERIIDTIINSNDFQKNNDYVGKNRK